MKNIKGWNKLFIQVGILSISMLLISTFTDSEFYMKWFTYEVDGSLISHIRHDRSIFYGCDHPHCHKTNTSIHNHLNYRGFIYTLTGLVFFAMSVFRIILSHKETDFK